jgi:hypothetical protein
MCKIALSLFALGTVAGLPIASLCVPLVYAGEIGSFSVSLATYRTFVSC